MKHTLTVVLYLCVIVMTGLMTFDLGAPEMIDGGGIVVASPEQIAHMTAITPDHCIPVPDTDVTWGLSIDTACSHWARALAYADRAHLVEKYKIRGFLLALFVLGFSFSCLRATLKPTVSATIDSLREIGFYGWMWAPWPIMLSMLIDRTDVFRDIIPVWPTNGF
jgi:hypothetical protein